MGCSDGRLWYRDSKRPFFFFFFFFFFLAVGFFEGIVDGGYGRRRRRQRRGRWCRSRARAQRAGRLIGGGGRRRERRCGIFGWIWRVGHEVNIWRRWGKSGRLNRPGCCLVVFRVGKVKFGGFRETNLGFALLAGLSIPSMPSGCAHCPGQLYVPTQATLHHGWAALPQWWNGASEGAEARSRENLLGLSPYPISPLKQPIDGANDQLANALRCLGKGTFLLCPICSVQAN